MQCEDSVDLLGVIFADLTFQSYVCGYFIYIGYAICSADGAFPNRFSVEHCGEPERLSADCGPYGGAGCLCCNLHNDIKSDSAVKTER